MHWYYNNGADPRQSEIIVSVLEPVGYRLVRTNIRYGGEDHLYETLMTPEEVRQHDEYEREFNEVIDHIKNNKTIDVTITANPEPEYDEEGTFTMPTDNKSILIVVSEAKEQYYNGYTYYLPIINGKVRRVKNKKMTIDCTNYEILENRILIRI